MIKVMIVDDHPLVREGFKKVLECHPGIEVAGTYENSIHLMEALKGNQPDILLLDLQLSSGLGGRELVAVVKKAYPLVRIIILTSNDNVYNIQLLLNSGVEGYLLKNMEQRLLIEAIERVYQKELFLSPEVKDILIRHGRKQHNTFSGKELLTPREKDILQLIAEEHTSQEIGKKLNLSYRTVETYRLGIMQKLGVRNMVGMTKQAIVLGLIR